MFCSDHATALRKCTTPIACSVFASILFLAIQSEHGPDPLPLANSVRFEKNIGIYGQPLNAIFGNYCTERTQSPIASEPK